MKRIVAVVILCSVLLLATACRGDGVSDEELDFYAQAARVFNQDDTAHRLAATLGGTQARKGRVYASVGIAADYPDQVLVTVSAPSMSYALQFMFDPANPPYQLGVTEVSEDSLPESVKQWNATIDDEGYLLVDGREEASMP